MDEVIATLSAKKGRLSGVFSLTKSELIWKWEKGAECGEASIFLSKLKPRVERSSSRQSGAERKLLTGIVLSAIAIVIFFSTLQEFAPLLFSLFAFGGAILIVLAMRNWRIIHYSGFAKKDNEWFAWVIHGRCDSHELEQFKAAFEDACKSAQIDADRCTI